MKPASLTKRQKRILVIRHTDKRIVVHKNDESDKYQIANPFFTVHTKRITALKTCCISSRWWHEEPKQTKVRNHRAETAPCG